jgi:hypothetical protein
LTLAAKALQTEITDIVPYPNKAANVDYFPIPPTFVNLDIFFRHLEDISEEQWEEFRNLMRTEFLADPMNYSTSSVLAYVLFRDELEGVAWLRGFPAQQIKRCEAKIICGSGTPYPFKMEGDFVSLDRNGSYTSVYTTFPGIPIGKPTFKRPEENPDAYYYIKVAVLEFRCKHEKDPFPLLTRPGIHWMDKVMFELIDSHYEWQYEILGGWYFKNQFENTISEKARDLWKLKMENPNVSHLIKHVLNSFYGRSCQLLRGKKNGFPERPEVLNVWWSQPQFGVNVKSWSRKVMQEIIYKAVDLGMEIFYSNTDSIFVSRSDAQWLQNFGIVEIGPELGQWKIEKEFTKFICLGPKTYWMRMRDGSVKHSFGQSEEEWWWESRVEEQK